MMRLRAAVAVAVVAVCGLTASAQTVYVTEPFTYTSGQNLTGLTGSGTGFSSTSWTQTSSSTLTTSGTGQTYSNLAVSGRSVTSTGGESIYTRTISAAATPTANDYWVSFLVTTNASNNQYAGLDLGGNLYIGKASNDTTYGIANTGNPSDNVSHPTGPSVTTADLLVAHFRPTGANTGAIDLYVNPTSLGGTAPLTGFVTSTLTTQTTPALSGTALRLFSGSINGAGGPSTIFSDLRIGDSFAAVTPVPEPLTVGLLAAAGLVLTRLRRMVV